MQPRLVFFWLSVLAALGLLAVLLVTQNGSGVGPDSTKLLEAAENVAAGRGYVLTGTGASVPLTQWPPLFPAIISGAQLSGITALQGARLLNAFAFALNIFLVGAILFTASRSARLAVIGSAAMLLCVDMLRLHAVVLSEPLFVLGGIASFYFLALYLATGRLSHMAAAALCAAASFLARYPGLMFAVTGTLVLMRFRARSGFRLAAGYFAAAALPGILWMLRNRAVAGSMTGNTIGFQLASLPKRVFEFLRTLSGWIVPAPLPGAVRFPLALVILGLLVAVAVRAGGRRPQDDRAVSRPTITESLRSLLASFLVVYMGFLLLSQIFADAHTPFDGRLLAPLFPCLVILLSLRIHAALVSPSGREWAPRAMGVVALVLGAAYIAGAVFWLRSGYLVDMGYTSPMWTQSPTLAALRQMSSPSPIYSNAPDVIRFLMKRPALKLPNKNDPGRWRTDPEFENRMTALVRDLSSRDGVVVYFRNSSRNYLATEAELKSDWGLTAARELADGSILRSGSPSPTVKLKSAL